MKCFEFDQLAAYVDGVLSKEENKHVEKHLEFCPACREVVTMLQKEDVFLQEVIQSPVLPEGFDDEVLSKLEPYMAKKKRWNWPYQLLTAASIVLAFGLGASFLSDNQQSDTGNSETAVVREEKDALYSIENEGVLLEVTDISASPLKIEVFYRLKPEKQVIENYLAKHNVQHISQIVDEYEVMPPAGKILNENGQELPFREVSWGGSNKDIFQNSVVIKPAEVENLPDMVTVKVNFEELFLQDGTWDLEIPIDLREAKMKTNNYPLNNEYVFDDFQTQLLGWKTSSNSHIFTLETEYIQTEKEGLEDVLGKREDLHFMIMPELMLVTKTGGRKLIADGVTNQTHRRHSFTTQFEFTNRLKGMEATKNLPIDEELVLIVEGFRLHEPENTQFQLTDQSETVQVNDWVIESVTTEPETENSKMVTITGRTSIENIEDFTLEVKGESQRFIKETIITPVRRDGTFSLQVQMTNSTINYQIEIQSINKWVPHKLEIPLSR